MQSALSSAKIADVCWYRKHDESINAIGVYGPKSNRSGTCQSEIQDLKCQVQTFTELVSGNKSGSSDLSNVSHTKSDVSEHREEVQMLTSLISWTNTKATPQSVHVTSPRIGRDHCYKCKGRGHQKVDCNWNGDSDSFPSAKCQLCMENGHTANKCKQLASENQPSPKNGHDFPGSTP